MDDLSLEKKIDGYKKLMELKTETLVMLYIELQTRFFAINADNQRLRDQNSQLLGKVGIISQQRPPQGQPQRQPQGQRPQQQGQKGLETGQKQQNPQNVGNKALPPVEFPKSP